MTTTIEQALRGLSIRLRETKWIIQSPEEVAAIAADAIDAALAAHEAQQPLTNIITDAIEGYKAGLAGGPIGLVSEAFDCGWSSGDSERATLAAHGAQPAAMLSFDIAQRIGNEHRVSVGVVQSIAKEVAAHEAQPGVVTRVIGGGEYGVDPPPLNAGGPGRPIHGGSGVAERVFVSGPAFVAGGAGGAAPHPSGHAATPGTGGGGSGHIWSAIREGGIRDTTGWWRQQNEAQTSWVDTALANAGMLNAALDFNRGVEAAARLLDGRGMLDTALEVRNLKE